MTAGVLPFLGLLLGGAEEGCCGDGTLEDRRKTAGMETEVGGVVENKLGGEIESELGGPVESELAGAVETELGGVIENEVGGADGDLGGSGAVGGENWVNAGRRVGRM